MADDFKFSKRLTSDTDEVIIRAQVAEREGGRFHAVTFEKSRVDYITDVGGGVSGIALKTGAKIAVAMPYEELEKKIYFSDARDTPVLDLRDVTGAAAQKALGTAGFPEPAEDFASAAAKPQGGDAEKKRPLVDKPLKIAAFARQANEQNFQMVFVMDNNIDWASVTGEDGKNGKVTKLPLRLGKGPFGDSTLILDMPRPAFMEIYTKAKMDGLDELDLRDWTRRRDPDKTPPPPKRPFELG